MSETDSESLANTVRVDGSGRRRYRERFKQALIERCLQPGASVSKLSIEAGVNTNLVRKWIRKAQLAAQAGSADALLPVVLDTAPTAAVPPAPRLAGSRPEAAIEIELGAARIRIHAGADSAQIGAIIAALKP